MFFSTFPYVLRHISEGHMAHTGAYERTLKGQIENPTWPSFKTLRSARKVLLPGEGLAFYELGATLIHQARCRAAGEFMRSKEDVWVSCDEDVEAGPDAIRELVEHVSATQGVALAAYRLRGDKKWSVGGLEGADHEVTVGLVTSGPYDFRGGAGAGLFAAHRAAILNVARTYVEEPDGALSPLLFEARAVPNGGHHLRWEGEDVNFCSRLRSADVPMHVFFFPDVTHDGVSNAIPLMRAR